VKYEFASDEWLTGVERAIQACVEEARATGQLEGVSFSLCEVYGDVPVAVNPAGRVAWSAVFADEKVTFSRSELDTADLKVVADYEVLRPIVSVKFDADPSLDVMQALSAAGKQGRFRIDRSAPSPAAIASLHNRVAGITL
jgi:hypothetical protein